MRHRVLLWLLILIWCSVVLSQEIKSERPAPVAYDVREAYEVYAAVLPNEWTWKDAHSPALLIRLETVTYEMCIHPDKESEDVLGPVIENYNDANKKTLLLQRNFEIDKPYDLVPAKEINQVLQNDALLGWKAVVGQWTPPGDKHPKYVGSVELSAVGFNPEKTIAIVYVGHHCGSLCGGGEFYVFEKKDGKWQPLKWQGSSCVWAS